MGLFTRRKTVFVDSDILIVGGGMAGCGATYESRYWGRDLKIVCVEKANIERSGAVAQGLYAINCYMGMQWNENQPEDHVRYARNDLMGLVREDLGYDIARHVDATVHKFEEWGLPIMRDPKTGRYQREGKWQIMIYGESYKPIVAEAARKAATDVLNRIMVTHLLMDKTKPDRVAGAVGFNVRSGDFYVFRAKAVIVCAGGASHIFKPRAVGEGMGRTWYAPWSSASAYALPILAGAKMTQMENRIVLTRFKDGYGPVGAYFLHLKTYTENAYGEEYESKWRDHTMELVGDYVDHHPVPTCLRNHALLQEVKAGRGPIRMVTKEAFQDPHKETVGWENFLGMTIGQAVVWASQNIDPKHINPELDHVRALRHGLPRHVLRRMGERTGGLRPLGIPVGIQPHDDRRWTFRRRRHHRRHRPQILVRILHRGPDRRKGGGQLRERPGKEQPQVSEAEYEDLKKLIFQPLENYRVGRNEIVAGTVSPSYILPIHGLQRLEQIMDEYVGGISSLYTTNEPLLTRGLELLSMLKEDLNHLGAEDLHQLQRAWELQHRVLASEAVTRHTMFRTETRWPGYYYRADHPKLDDANWHCFTLSRYDRHSGNWELEKAPVYHIVD